MKKLITLILIGVFLCPIWVNAQITPQVIGTVTWNFSPDFFEVARNPRCDPCGTYYLHSMTATITHNGNEVHSIAWKGEVEFTAPWHMSYNFRTTGVGSMQLEHSTYFMYLHAMIAVPMSGQFASIPSTAPPVPFYFNCWLDSTSLAGNCINASGSSTQATVVKN